MAHEASYEDPPFRMTPVVLHTLLAMIDGEVHGYGIIQEVAQRTEGRVSIAPGSLYFTLDRLMDATMIEESDVRPEASVDDPRRKYYKLTDYGRAVLRNELTHMADIVAFARSKELLTRSSEAS